jgi:hypothetical protein
MRAAGREGVWGGGIMMEREWRNGKGWGWLEVLGSEEVGE